MRLHKGMHPDPIATAPRGARVVAADSVGDPKAGMLQSESASDDVNYAIGLESQYVVYANVRDPIKLFAGAGPFIEYMRAAFEETNTAGDPNESGLIRDVRRTRSTGAGGITAVLGGEWFVTRYISLSAEYGLALGYARAEEEIRTETIRNRIETITDERIIRAWELRPSGVRFGLSLYLWDGPGARENVRVGSTDRRLGRTRRGSFTRVLRRTRKDHAPRGRLPATADRPWLQICSRQSGTDDHVSACGQAVYARGRL